MQRQTTKITQTTLARIARMVQGGEDADHEIADTVVCTENLNSDVVVMKSAKDGA